MDPMASQPHRTRDTDRQVHAGHTSSSPSSSDIGPPHHEGGGVQESVRVGNHVHAGPDPGIGKGCRYHVHYPICAATADEQILRPVTIHTERLEFHPHKARHTAVTGAHIRHLHEEPLVQLRLDGGVPSSVNRHHALGDFGGGELDNATALQDFQHHLNMGAAGVR